MKLTQAEQWGIGMLSRGSPGVIRLFKDILQRQERSHELHLRAQESLSGLQVQLPYTAPLFPICVDRAEGAHIWDVDGNEYIDCHMAYTATVLGHNPSDVLEPFEHAMKRGLGGGHFFEEHLELADLVKDLVPGVERVAYFHTGGEAVSGAIRMARAATGKRRVAKFEGCYHGNQEEGLHNTMMALSGQGPEGDEADIAPTAATAGVPTRGSEDYLILAYNTNLALEAIREHADELACVVVDPVPPFLTPWPDVCHGFLSCLRRVTAEVGVPLIFDEVVSGFRIARGGAREWIDGPKPDISCFGKITSGLGLPLSIVAGDARYLDVQRTDGMFRDYPARKAWLSSTLGGNHPAVAAGLAQLRYLADNYEAITERLDANHADLKARLADIAERTGVAIGVHGHPRLQMQLSIGKQEPEEPTYRGVMATATIDDFRGLMALTFYMRARGVYMKSLPTMNLSAAHTSADIAAIAEAVEGSLNAMIEDKVVGDEVAQV